MTDYISPTVLNGAEIDSAIGNIQNSNAGKLSTSWSALLGISGFFNDGVDCGIVAARDSNRAVFIGAAANSGGSGMASVNVTHYDPSTGAIFYNIELWHSGNTTVDGSGFIKEASPIIKLFANSIESNEMVPDGVQLIKNGVGNYTITGTEGFAQTGWYIEQPKDANGNTKHYIEYQQDSDGTIHIQVYNPDYSMGKVSAGAPCDVVEGRWIDIRLQKLEVESVE